MTTELPNPTPVQLQVAEQADMLTSVLLLLWLHNWQYLLVFILDRASSINGVMNLLVKKNVYCIEAYHPGVAENIAPLGVQEVIDHTYNWPLLIGHAFATPQ